MFGVEVGVEWHLVPDKTVGKHHERFSAQKTWNYVDVDRDSTGRHKANTPHYRSPGRDTG